MKLIKGYKNSVLLEDKNYFRFIVDKKLYEEFKDQDETLLENGIPYSLPFDLFILDGTKEQNELYKAGIHRLEDILQNRKTVTRILRNNKLSTEDLIEKIKGDL